MCKCTGYNVRILDLFVHVFFVCPQTADSDTWREQGRHGGLPGNAGEASGTLPRAATSGRPQLSASRARRHSGGAHMTVDDLC